MIFTTKAEVEAPPRWCGRCWQVHGKWPAWTESIDSVELLEFDGELDLGSRARVSQPRMRPLVWTVSEFEPGRAFSWTSSVGGVTTVGTHATDDVDGGRRSRLTLGLTQSGVLAPLVGLLLGRRTRRYVALELAGLKAAAERARRAVGPSTG